MKLNLLSITVGASLLVGLNTQSLVASTTQPTEHVFNLNLASDQPLTALCALYKETGDIRVLELIERLAARKTSLEQTKHITETIKNGIWWSGFCIILALWWRK